MKFTFIDLTKEETGLKSGDLIVAKIKETGYLVSGRLELDGFHGLGLQCEIKFHPYFFLLPELSEVWLVQ